MFVCPVFLDKVKRMFLRTERTLLYSILVNRWFPTCALPDNLFDRWFLLEKQHFFYCLLLFIFLHLTVVIRVAQEKWRQKGP